MIEPDIGVYRHIDDTGRVTKVSERAVNEWSAALEKAQRQVDLPSMEEIALEIARQLHGIRKALEGIRVDMLGPTPSEPPKTKAFPNKALFDALEQLGYKVKVTP